MSKIDINEIYTLFEEIKELIKSKESNNAEVQPEIVLPDLSAITDLSDKLDKTITRLDNIVILSTCITNQKSSRYLVCGVLINNEKTD